jgi:uridylate kinase
MEETIVISLGGSLIVPDQIDTDFLKNFKNLILSEVKRGKKFVIITGGGKTCRRYNEALEKITNPSKDALDWLGIAATRLNSELIRISFGDLAFDKIIMDPDVIPNTDKPIMLGAGWKPGNSSDLAAVHIAKSLGAKKLINLSNVDYVYNKDPKKFPDAEKIESSTWVDFRNILPKNWDPGLNAPFDPVAAKEAQELGLEVIVLNGRNIANLEKCLDGKEFMGTKIK